MPDEKPTESEDAPLTGQQIQELIDAALLKRKDRADAHVPTSPLWFPPKPGPIVPPLKKKGVTTMLILILLIILLAGGGYFGYNRYGTQGGISIGGLMLVILIVWLLFGMPHGHL